MNHTMSSRPLIIQRSETARALALSEMAGAVVVLADMTATLFEAHGCGD
jgi:hypothetical protein